jgi:uncharacterized membrane protein YqjE
MSLYPVYRPEEQPSLTGLVRQLLNNVSELIQQHIELTKTELKMEGKRLSKAAGFGVFALLLFQIFLISLGAVGVLALHNAANLTWVSSAMIVTVIYLVLLAVCAVLCIQQIQSAKHVMQEAHPEAQHEG